ncbi:myc proto-oncogene protein isoform X2 [Procambarus clarkii]|uniref:myc proto-oncogene protein isoform X2 n=1 Tax=Procambarus clarkii TaxID=6728 RepID=UPI001E676D52|nr:N-myc proto-oncogene protein-like isoform X2 [Procambarus clarkii]
MQMATHPDILRLLPESWITPPQHLTSSVPLDMWGRFDIENDRALAVMDHNMTFPTDIGDFIPGESKTPHHMGAPPTPPHSPPTEHDLDDLVASIPEILESPSATPPSDISDILSDLEGMEMTPMFRAPGYSWWAPVAPPVPEVSLKRDIMWGGGTCCQALLEPPIKKERQESECSADAALRDALKQEDISEDDDDFEDNLPDTPSGTDSDCDADDHMSETSSNSGSPRSTNSASRYSTSSTVFRNSSCTPYVTPSVNFEHDYCGRVPEPDAHSMAGILTPSDTEDEVDVVTCSDPNETATTTTISLGNYTIYSPSSSSSSPVNSTTPTSAPSCLQVPSKRSVDVKRQLQLAIQEAMRNRHNRVPGSTSPESDEVASNRFVSVKIKTQGKPAAYTKRMRDYHTESTKHKRRNRVESDEGRRSVHNSLERQRRVDLRNAFEYLRQLVPDTKVLEKAPKVQILKKAALHCKQLHLTEQRLLKEKEKLKKQLEELQQRRLQSS